MTKQPKALWLAEMIEGVRAPYCGAAAAELRRLAAVEADCAPYLKEGETPAERIKRALGDADSLMSLYRDVVAERDALRSVLRVIVEQDPVDLALDPQWSQRIAKGGLEATIAALRERRGEQK